MKVGFEWRGRKFFQVENPWRIRCEGCVFARDLAEDDFAGYRHELCNEYVIDAQHGVPCENDAVWTEVKPESDEALRTEYAVWRLTV